MPAKGGGVVARSGPSADEDELESVGDGVADEGKRGLLGYARDEDEDEEEDDTVMLSVW